MLAYKTVLQAHKALTAFMNHGLGAAGGDRCCLVAPWWQIWERLTRTARSEVVDPDYRVITRLDCIENSILQMQQ